MTTRELLTDYLETERNNVFSYAATYLMTQPKRGYEREFSEARERAELLEDLLTNIDRLNG